MGVAVGMGVEVDAFCERAFGETGPAPELEGAATAAVVPNEDLEEASAPLADRLDLLVEAFGAAFDGSFMSDFLDFITLPPPCDSLLDATAGVTDTEAGLHAA